jgi:hypothetical protein
MALFPIRKWKHGNQFVAIGEEHSKLLSLAIGIGWGFGICYFFKALVFEIPGIQSRF